MENNEKKIYHIVLIRLATNVQKWNETLRFCMNRLEFYRSGTSVLHVIALKYIAVSIQMHFFDFSKIYNNVHLVFIRLSLKSISKSFFKNDGEMDSGAQSYKIY